ncbi:MAG TPA: hypothetical protein VJJ26_03480 [Candidatus Babeliales bacterium]|nr:hypothetical protein [Candidatus Babeliales bacterium]
MNKRPDFKIFKKEILKDAKIRAEYEALGPEFELIRQSIKARLQQKNSSKKLNHNASLIKSVKKEEIEDIYFESIAHKTLQEEDEYITHTDVKKKIARKNI